MLRVPGGARFLLSTNPPSVVGEGHCHMGLELVTGKVGLKE